jgi:uncharacterized protein
VDIEGRRRSDNFEDRGDGGGGARGAAGLPIMAIGMLLRRIGMKGTLILAAIAAVVYFVLPASVRQMLFGAVTGGDSTAATGSSGGSVCEASATNGKACDFSRTVLASTEDVWTAQFKAGRLPRYGREAGEYQPPRLVVYARGVSTGGCGNASSDAGPFYCPGDRMLYLDPSFYDVMEQKLRAPGDFAQAYVIAHEVGHHVQNLIGSTQLHPKGESANQTSVRVELQADCFAGVWGHTAKSSLNIDDSDLREAVNAAHAIGDDALGHQSADDYTHGTSEQRMRWFKTGFESGDARRCDTFAVDRSAAL